MANSSFRNRWLAGCSCLGALGLIGLLCLIPLILTSRNRLTIVGKRTADSSNWQQSYDGYYWDSNESQVAALNGRSGTLLRLDDRSGRTMPVVPVTGRQGMRLTANQSSRPSPDGRWLLFRPRGAASFTAVEMRTHRTVTWKASPRGLFYALWFPDSRRWAEFSRSADGKKTQPIVHSIDAPDLRTASITDTFIWPIGTASKSHVFNARNADHLEVWEYDLEGNPAAPQKHRIALPSGALVQEVEGSPDGSRLAYLIQEERETFLSRLFDRFIPRNSDSGATVSLWVSRADGSGLRRIGFERAKASAGVQWAPDGKRLSLFLDDGFYLVPVD